MYKVREIARLHLKFALKVRHIARACKISSSTAHQYVTRIVQSQLSWEKIECMDDLELMRIFENTSDQKRPTAKPLPDFEQIHKDMKKKGVTLQLLWEEYKISHPDGYGRTQFCHLYKEWLKPQDPVMRQNHKAGEKGFVDFSGDKPCFFDPETNERIEAELFVAVMGASSFTFACAVPDQTIPSWISCHAKAFEYFQGCPEIVVPDNLKSGVTKACYYDPDINPTYQEMAEHYNIVILPARPNKARDKAKVETGVLNVQQRVLAALRNRRFFSLHELNQAIKQETEKLNDRKMQVINKSRRELFEEIDKPVLQPLPEKTYKPLNWKRVTVPFDYHVEVEGKYYSVPYTLIRKVVDVRYSSEVVEVLHNRKRVASHCRIISSDRSTTDPSHRPHEHRKYLEWTPEKIKSQANIIGKNTAEVIEKILEKAPHPESAFRMCLGILRLSKEYKHERLETACGKILEIGAYKYSVLKKMLQNKMDQAEIQTVEAPAIYHSNIRGKDYYREENQC